MLNSIMKTLTINWLSHCHVTSFLKGQTYPKYLDRPKKKRKKKEGYLQNMKTFTKNFLIFTAISYTSSKRWGVATQW